MLCAWLAWIATTCCFVGGRNTVVSLLPTDTPQGDCFHLPEDLPECLRFGDTDIRDGGIGLARCKCRTAAHRSASRGVRQPGAEKKTRRHGRAGNNMQSSSILHAVSLQLAAVKFIVLCGSRISRKPKIKISRVAAERPGPGAACRPGFVLDDGRRVYARGRQTRPRRVD